MSFFNTLAGYVLKYFPVFISIELFLSLHFILLRLTSYLQLNRDVLKELTIIAKKNQCFKNPVVSLCYHLLINTIGIQGATYI